MANPTWSKTEQGARGPRNALGYGRLSRRAIDGPEE